MMISSNILKSIEHILFGSCDSSFFSFNFQQFVMLVPSFSFVVCNGSTNAADITTGVGERLIILRIAIAMANGS